MEVLSLVCQLFDTTLNDVSFRVVPTSLLCVERAHTVQQYSDTDIDIVLSPSSTWYGARAPVRPTGSGWSLVYTLNNRGDSTEPCGRPFRWFRHLPCLPFSSALNRRFDSIVLTRALLRLERTMNLLCH